MIRPLTPSDSEQFKNLRLETLKTDPDSWYSKYEVEKDFSSQRFAEKIINAIIPPVFGYYGYFEGEKLCGYIQLSDNYWAKKRHVATVSDVCVSPIKRKSGIGSSLVKFVIEKAKEVSYLERLELWVNSPNKAAMNLYKKLGFEKVAEIPNSLKDGDGNYQNENVYILRI